MHVEIGGPLTLERLEVALRSAQDRHPLLRMRISEEKLDLWFRSQGVGALPVRIVDMGTDGVASEAEKEIRAQFDTANGPLARCAWLRHGPEHSTLLLTFHHVIGDGISGSYLIRDILEALSGKQLEPLPLAESLDGHMPARAQGISGVLGYLRILGMFFQWIFQKGPPRGIPNEKKARLDERQAIVHFQRFDSRFTEALTARARAEGTTVHAALAAAIMIASFPEMKSDRAHTAFGSPLNMRDRFEPPIADDLGFYVAMAASSHKLHAQNDFWQLAREIKSGINRAIAVDMPFYGLSGMAPILVFAYRLFGGGSRGRYACTKLWDMLMFDSLGLTNIGRVSIKSQYGAYAVKAVGFAPSLSVLGNNAWTAATIDGTLCLNFVCMEPLISRETQLRIAERVRAVLESTVKTTHRFSGFQPT